MVLVKLLKKEYKRRSRLKPLLWDSTIQLPIEQVYTRLKIVSRGKLSIQTGHDEVNLFDSPPFRFPHIGDSFMTIAKGGKLSIQTGHDEVNLFDYPPAPPPLRFPHIGTVL